MVRDVHSNPVSQIIVNCPTVLSHILNICAAMKKKQALGSTWVSCWREWTLGSNPTFSPTPHPCADGLGSDGKGTPFLENCTPGHTL
jgi:hypothetical protein